MGVPPSTIYDHLRGRLHQCQQMLTPGEEQAIMARVEEMVLWCFPPPGTSYSNEMTIHLLHLRDVSANDLGHKVRPFS
jgi:hypothetical protein